VLIPLAKFVKKSCNTLHKFALYNLLINDLIIDQNLDCLGLVETWQQQNDFFHLNSATPPGFVYLSKPRASGKGGGLALIYRKSLKVELLMAIYKQKGDRAECGNSCGISLLSIGGKVLAKNMLNRLVKYISEAALRNAMWLPED